MRALCLLIGVLLSLSALAQHQVGLNTNFFLSQRPVFQAGYAFSADSSVWTWGVNAEFGRFANVSRDVNNAQMDIESSIGFGVMPEVRYFFSDDSTPFGPFVTSFCRVRRFTTTTQYGVELTPDGFQLEDPVTQRKNQTTARYGIGMGYRSGCYANLIHMEVLGGAFLGNFHGEQADFTNIRHDQVDQYIRLELNLVAVF